VRVEPLRQREVDDLHFGNSRKGGHSGTFTKCPRDNKGDELGHISRVRTAAIAFISPTERAYHVLLLLGIKACVIRFTRRRGSCTQKDVLAKVCQVGIRNMQL
jgi:hypothetical protein